MGTVDTARAQAIGLMSGKPAGSVLTLRLLNRDFTFRTDTQGRVYYKPPAKTPVSECQHEILKKTRVVKHYSLFQPLDDYNPRHWINDPAEIAGWIAEGHNLAFPHRVYPVCTCCGKHMETEFVLRDPGFVTPQGDPLALAS